MVVHSDTVTLTHRDRVLQALRLSSQPLDDDELSSRTSITPRQAVNQVCHALEVIGVLRRVPGPDGKIVNVLVSTNSDQPLASALETASVTPASRHDVGEELNVDVAGLPAGSSGEQRAAERVMLDLLAARLGLPLDPARLTVASGARVEIDGTDPGRTVLVECWAHQGAPKAAQRHKVLSDALKLTWIGSTIYPRPRLVLCLSDTIAAAPFLSTSRTWASQALADLAITVEVVDLPDDIRAGIVAAQVRQRR
jgi:hypothetical protein